MGRARPESLRLLASALGLTDDEQVELRAGVGAGEPARPAPRQLPVDIAEFTGRAAADARLDGPEPARVTAAAAARVVPAQLPADVYAFTGRTAELFELDALVPGGDPAGQTASAPEGDGSTAVVISAVSGTAGVGKTALAVRWAHRVSAGFGDGQLYVNLRGYDPDLPMSPGDALARFLRGLGVAGEDIPFELDERAARYRTELAGRRVLIVLDNASTVEQVRPLLPGTPAAMVVVTSRDALAGLVAVHGAHRLDLDLLPLPDAVALLRHLIGPTQVDAEPDAAAALAVQCARLPLALRVAAEFAVRRGEPLTQLVTELADRRQRLDALDAAGDPRAAVTAVFSWSVQHLPADAARLFRLLGLHHGSDLDPYAAAALANTIPVHARRLLDTLARAHLTQPTGAGRYGVHDLLRAYAIHLATTHDTEEERRAALDRLFDYYLAAAAAAMDAWYPAEAHRRPRVQPAATPPPVFTSETEALAWLDAERAVLASACAYTAAHGWPAHTVALATTLYRYLDAGGHHTDALAVHGHAHHAAHHTGDHTGEATALSHLGVAYWRQGRHGPATDHLEQALAVFRQTGDRHGQARALTNLGNVHWAQGRYQQAAEHHQQALDLHRETGDQTGEAGALANLGCVHWRQGRYEQAAEHHQQALDLFRQAGDRAGEADALGGLGDAHARQGRYQQAAEHHRQALDLSRQTGNRDGEADALGGLGDAHARQGRHEQAAEHHRQALDLFRQAGDRAGEADALNSLGETAQAAGRPKQALDQHTSALALATDIGERYQQARAHDGLAHAHRTLGDTTQARAHWQQALARYADMDTPEAAQVRAALATVDQSDPAPRSPRSGRRPGGPVGAVDVLS